MTPARLCESYGADVTRVTAEWGRACDPAALERVLASAAFDVVGVVELSLIAGAIRTRGAEGVR